jgi:alcohol dehydrogenase class IV
MLARHHNTSARKSFRAATRLYAGPDARLDLPALLPEGPVLLVVDLRFANCDAVRALPIARRVEVSGEPKRSHIDLALGLLEGERFSSVLAIGGGSTIDTAKALHAALSFGTYTVRDLERAQDAPMLVAVPTTAGSGSEASRFFIFSDRKGLKRSHRAWSHAPDIALIDPFFLRRAEPERLALGAFDSFVHLFEAYVCRNENTPAADMLALEGISLIARALERLSAGAALDDTQLMGLQHASAYGGLAISNVRTGLIHTLGESLSAQCTLAHPETLYVFFEAALAHYQAAITEKLARLDRRLVAELGQAASFARLRALWRGLFETHGIARRIEETLAARPPDIRALLAAAARDHVLPWEHPVSLTPDDLRFVVETRLQSPSSAARRAAG